VRNVRVERMTVEKSAYALFLRAIDGAPIRGLSVKDSTFRNVAKGNRIEGTVDLEFRNVTLLPSPAPKKDLPGPAATPAAQK
jgi:hypothetical protein